MAVFITGGARSGKSDFAESYAMRLGDSGIYIATSQIWDEEMAQRIGRHRRMREKSGFGWRTIEEPYALAEQLHELDRAWDGIEERPVVLVDCLTLWLSNWMLRPEPGGEGMEQPMAEARTSQPASMPEQTADGDAGAAANSEFSETERENRLEEAVDGLVQAAIAFRGPLLLVTNEVGSGIVPAYPLGRRFRDAAGRMNRKLAAVCGEAYLVVAGIPLDLKALAFRLEDR